MADIPLPIGVTVDRYHVNGNAVPFSDPASDSNRDVYVERKDDTSGFFIANNPWSDSELWNFTLGDWHNPWTDDSYDPAHYERPESEAVAKARQIVGLDDA